MSASVWESKARAIRALMADTLQEAWARWLFRGMIGLSTLLILIFLFVLKIDLVASAVSIMGIETTVSHVDVRKFVNQSYAFVSVFLYIWGTLLAIFASSGLIPSVLEAGRISLLLSKPITRPILLLGRYAGNLIVVAINHVYLVMSVWCIIGLKTGIWEKRFLLAIPDSLFIFAVLLTVVVLIGVLSESAALATMVPVALMLISTILAQRQMVVKLLSSQWSRNVWQVIYWIVPKVYDLANAMRQMIVFDREADWWTPVWTSAVFGLIVLWSAIRVFQRRDF